MPVIDEYLVKLGSVVDQSGMQRFHQALREASVASEVSATAIAGSFFKAQTEIVGGFASISSAALGMVDKVAMADQSYRLLALDMHITKEGARGLKVTMDALGASLGQLTWDPELRARAQQLIADQRAMAPNGDFDAQMKKVRDIRFEFTRMEVEGEYLAMHVAEDFMKALGVGPDELLGKLQKFNNWVIKDLPKISKHIVAEFLPVWLDVEKVGLATGKAFEAAGLAFTNLIGIFDHSLGGTTFDFEKFAKAVGEVVGTFATWADGIAKVEEGLMHLVSAMALVAQGKMTAAGKELGAAGSDATPASIGAGIVPGAIGTYLGWKFFKSLLAKAGLKSASAEAAAGAVGEEAAAEEIAAVSVAAAPETGGVSLLGLLAAGGVALGGSWLASNGLDAMFGSNDLSSIRKSSGRGRNADINGFIDKYAKQMGVDPRLARAVQHAESPGGQFDKNGNLIKGVGSNGVHTSATGAFQLLDGTAAALGVDSANTEDNVKGGILYLSQLLKQYGNVDAAVGAYHDGPSHMNAVLAGRATLSPDARRELENVHRSMGAHGDVHVGSIVVHVDKPNATNADVGNAVAAKVRGLQNKRIQRNLAEFQDLSWSS